MALDMVRLRRERAVGAVQAEGWRECAAQYARNAEFYRDIVHQIGEMFGEGARTSDDGSVQEDVLALKVPEIVEALVAHVERLRKAALDAIPYLPGGEIKAELRDAYDDTPETSLARLKAKWQAEVLDDAAEAFEIEGCHIAAAQALRCSATELRRQ